METLTVITCLVGLRPIMDDLFLEFYIVSYHNIGVSASYLSQPPASIEIPLFRHKISRW